MSRWATRRPYVLGVAAGLIYGLALRLMLHHLTPQVGKATHLWIDRFYPNDLWVMTAGFLVCAPFAIGWLTASASSGDAEYHWNRWIFAPWLAILLSNAFLLVAEIEGIICIVFAIPITLVFASLGGIAGGLAARGRLLHRGVSSVCVTVLPLLLAGLEMQFQSPLELRTVQTSILIHARAETIWHNIERVRAIEPAEIVPSWTHRVGFPLPMEATLDREGVGGVRHASFDHGLLFIETITAWEPGQRIAFSIRADTAHIPPTTLDEHVTIGGKYFDVLDGEYRLERQAHGDVLLHLSSHERLSTDFNTYAAWWSDAVMRDLQESILKVVKHRCEAESLAGSPSARLKP